jgi:hypothetical protein
MRSKLRVLVACEYSGAVRDAFIRAGHYAASCDILPSESPLGDHYQCDVLTILDHGWDLMIAHPPCTFMSNAGACRMYPQKGVIDPERLRKAMDAKEFFMTLLNVPIPRICVENPKPLNIVGLPPESQIVQPWQFGEPYTKKTLLWLKGLPPLVPTDIVTEGIVPFCPSGTSRKLGGKSLGAAKRGDDAKNRSKFFIGIADAMANQWSKL